MPVGPGDGPAPGPSVLRCVTIGTVGDGKSTLVARLLHDARRLHGDALRTVAPAGPGHGHGGTGDLTVGYAWTPRRTLVVADCPGHARMTRHMATGASTADVAVVVVDGRVGLRRQTRRHLCVAALVGVRHVVLAVNKMDLADWAPGAFEARRDEATTLALRLGVDGVTSVPVSALLGDNVAERSALTPWYEGPSLLDALEASRPGAGAADGGTGARLPVQWVIRHPGGGRSYAGMVSGGALRPGDEVVVLPSGRRSRITSVETFDGPMEVAPAALSVSVRLADDVDVSRGDLIASADAPPEVTRDFEATLCWFDDEPLVPGRRLRVKHTTRVTPAAVQSLQARLDVETLALEPAAALAANDIGVVRVTVGTPLVTDPYRANRVTGGFVVIDELTDATGAAGLVGAPRVAVAAPR